MGVTMRGLPAQYRLDWAGGSWGWAWLRGQGGRSVLTVGS